ncbi:MAG TPA: sensor domain-containing protein [Anaerolineales bacterium]|nr:sensor domain-containing protein [Anaerolineales bacterium]
MEYTAKQPSNILARFFGVIARGSTYLNLLYVLLAFPLGLFYFIFLVVGLSLGFSLLIILVGILVLLIVFAGWLAFGAFERQLAIWLLREDIPPMTPPKLRNRPAESAVSWNGFVAYLANPVTWTSLVYLFVKFPLGILSFVVSVAALSITAVFITSPLTFPFLQPEVWFTWNSLWKIDTLGDALIAFVIGLALLFISLHVLNGLAWVSGRFAWVMLGYHGAEEEVLPTAEAPAGATGSGIESETEPGAVPAPGPETAEETEETREEPAQITPQSREMEARQMNNMDTHVKVLGWLYIVLGVLGILGAFLVFVLVFGGGLISGDQQAIWITGIVATVVGGFLLLVSAPGIIAGFGLLGYRNWARVLALILGILNLPGFPIGTILGVYTLVVLLQDETSKLFVR